MSLEAVVSTAVYQEPAKATPKSGEKKGGVSRASKESGAAPITITEIAQPEETNKKKKTDQTGDTEGKNKTPTEKQLKDAVDKANNKLKQSRIGCEFSYHEATKTVQIKVIDQDSKEVIREIPTEKSLEILEKMWEVAGIIMDEKF